MNEWPLVALSDIAERSMTKNVGQVVQRVMTVSAAHGLIDQDKFFNKKVASVDLSTYHVIHPGEFVYNKSTSKDAAWGVVARSYVDEPVVVTPLYIPFRARAEIIDPEFMLMVCNGNHFFESLAGKLREGARAHGLLNVRLAEFFAASVPLPALVEQRRIVAVMAAVDAQTVALEAEVARLDGAYKASLASLADRYELRPIESVVTRAAAGGTPSRERADFFGGSIPWVKSGEVDRDSIDSASESITEAGLAGSSARWVEPGSILVAMYGQGDTKGKAGFVVRPVTTNQAVLALTPDRTVISERYLLHAVRSRTDSLRSRAIGAAQPNLSKALVISEAVPVPTDLEVQRLEASALDRLRASVDALMSELSALRTVRADLLSGMLSQEITVDEAVDHFVEAA